MRIDSRGRANRTTARNKKILGRPIDPGMSAFEIKWKNYSFIFIKTLTLQHCRPHFPQQCLPLRGPSDKLFKHNNGNFVKLVELSAKKYLVMIQKTSVLLIEKMDLKYFPLLGKTYE